MPKTPEYMGVVVSAGHSDTDPGATSKDGKLVESALTLRLRDLVAGELRKTLPVVLTDGLPSRNQSLPIAIQLNKKVAGPKVEFHFNANDNPAATGVEALSTPENKPLAKALAKAVSAVTGLPARGESGWRDQSKAGPHSRLGFCVSGGVILELAFITNPKDMKVYLANEKAIADAIVLVIKHFAIKRG